MTPELTAAVERLAKSQPILWSYRAVPEDVVQVILAALSRYDTPEWRDMEEAMADNARMREALKPFARIAMPINNEPGRISPLEVLCRAGTDELGLSSYTGPSSNVEILWADDLRNARAALEPPHD